jgi:hypothetical protein
MPHRFLALLTFTLTLTPGFAASAPGAEKPQVWTYPAPAEEFRSPDYVVRVSQSGRTQESFVYRHAHQDEHLRERGSDFNHWTTFSFSDPITIEVTRLSADAAGCTVLPSARGIQPRVAGRTATFSLDRPAKLFLRFPDAAENPLFIFADAPEMDVPDRKDPNVIWFEAGRVHDIGEKFTIKSGQTVYIPGGAYVKGTITADGASRIAVRGRGILSGLGYARRPNIAGIPFNSVMFNGPGDDQLIEGITVTNPQHFCLLSRGRLTTRNVKLFGWWHQTDGWGGGDGSSIEDSFIKVNDDSVKLYGKNQTARRLVIYQQVNGAPFQLGWGGASQRAQNCLVEDIDVVACDAADKTQREGNQAFLNLRHQSAESVIDGVMLRRIRFDCDIAMLVGFLQVKGTVRNVAFEDVTLHGKVNGKNYLRTEDAGSIAGLRFRDVTISGAGGSLQWATSGRVAPVDWAR